ncbi:Molybdopterin biosynthesis MoaE [Sodiomyces alkalinus F11]|uniref:Molybdopterin synthase catalytic subunit n=1 Tax=Sodiomyces alkalinus (strain CBS 110278 / VKM F-3762 / F11) TaxID=1314773 RepID=A0A3N2PLL8_SODAK|nr:Molybdopterin biosynthesis MoaE [Sodiomyces alkalinus F11]ROT35412.1 Molybdopterin biosynthesis MoaE [Sodiomyces alkalinus F11]
MATTQDEPETQTPPTQTEIESRSDVEGGEGPWTLTAPQTTILLTHAPLSSTWALDAVRSPEAGALVLFAGTTRAHFAGRRVRSLRYESYVPLALRTMLSVAERARDAHDLLGVAVAHRLGDVPVGEESVLIAVAAAHRGPAWRAGEEVLEDVKANVEVWKFEEFEDGGGVWRANRDGAVGVRVDDGEGKDGGVEGA